MSLSFLQIECDHRGLSNFAAKHTTQHNPHPAHGDPRHQRKALHPRGAVGSKHVASVQLPASLLPPAGEQLGAEEDEWKVEAVALIKAKKFTAARKKICESVRKEEIEDVYRWMYDNLQIWGESEEEQDSAIIKIRTGLVHHFSVSDPEINLSATLVDLMHG